MTQNGRIMQGRKTAAQVQRLEALHAKQQAVLRRKTEEAEAARKRLHVTFYLSCTMAYCSCHSTHAELLSAAVNAQRGISAPC